MFRSVLVGVAMVISADVAGAQITTYVAPARRDMPSPLTIASLDSARKDSVAQVAITNMKAWVDSAAGVPVPAHVGGIDTSALDNDPGRPVTTTFSEGSVAPATASDLPALALIGVIALFLGAALLATRPRS